MNKPFSAYYKCKQCGAYHDFDIALEKECPVQQRQESIDTAYDEEMERMEQDDYTRTPYHPNTVIR